MNVTEGTCLVRTPNSPFLTVKGLGFPTRFLPKPKNRVTTNPGFFQNRKTGFWLPVNPVFGFEFLPATSNYASLLTRNNSDVCMSTRTKSSAIAEGPRDASCQLKSCQLPRNSAETNCTTSRSDQVDVMKLELIGGNV